MVLCIGPEGSGKSLLLKKLQSPNYVDNTTTSVPTVGTNILSLRVADKLYTIREVGGTLAPMWPNYFVNVGKVMYVVDASNLCQISAAGVLLYTVLVNPLLRKAKSVSFHSTQCGVRSTRHNYVAFSVGQTNLRFQEGKDPKERWFLPIM
ncbi:hypothetical protein D910_00566, partial [Dendroctonus ponderosae]